MAESLAEYFKRITGKDILPYQECFGSDPLASTFLLVPTGLGKTLTVIVPWLRLTHHRAPGVPTRLILVLPRQNLTEQTFRIASELVAKAGLSGRVQVLQLMGGSDDSSRALDPDQPAIIVSTQDIYLSRALNRGYARRPTRWPIDFALLNQDCLLVFDEIQLMSDGLATSTQLSAFRQSFGIFGSAPCVWMSATARGEWLDTVDFAGARPALRLVKLEEADRKVDLVQRRLSAPKRIQPAPDTCRTPAGCAEFALSQHKPGTRTLVIANTVQRAREIFTHLQDNPGAILLHSRFRPPDRSAAVQRLEGIPPVGQIVVSTQVLEAGVDMTADTLITDAAPWGSLVQRFGRVNRYGDSEAASIWWVDRPLNAKLKPEESDEKRYAPYLPEDVLRAIEKLRSLTSAAPCDLPPEDGHAPWRHVLRRADLLDLFDTSPDLHGNEIDVSRFIRSGEERDCYLAWRQWEGDSPNSAPAEVRDEELCPVPIEELRSFLKKNTAFAWSFIDREWQPADRDRLYPGMILLAKSSAGGYTEKLGWTLESRKSVPPLPGLDTDPEADGTDPSSMHQTYRQTLVAHTDRVVEETERLLSALADVDLGPHRDDILLAASKHDWGKAHHVMQRTLHNSPQWGFLLAKQERSAAAAKHERKHFRHELASALAMISVGDSDLAAYLVAAHHGKVRVAVRSMPGETASERTRVRGIAEGDTLPAAQIATGCQVPPVTLSLESLSLGLNGGNAMSWIDRVIRLRDSLGPFRLAYLETLLRAADERASAQPNLERNNA